jgi:xylitol oxidase
VPVSEAHRLQNWAGNITFGYGRLARPTSVDGLVDVVRSSERVRALGTGHSFSNVADTVGTLVSLADLPSRIEVEVARRIARVSAATRWGDLSHEAARHGLALHNMGSLPHISVAGSAATGTHGSGSGLGCLASSVRALEMVTADGRVVSLTRGDDVFDGSVVALGSLGIVTTMEVDLVDSYDIEQTVWEGMPIAAAIDHLDDIMDCARSVSLFTTWSSDAVEQVWVKREVSQPRPDLAWLGASPAGGPRHPVPGMDPAACTEQLGVRGSWNERVPHFRMEFTPSSGDELQSEYMVPRSHGAAALAALRAIAPRIAPVVQISEIRAVAADSLWLSPFAGRDSLCLHFTWVSDVEAVMPAVRLVEEALTPFAARPHWGKVFAVEGAAIRSLYPRFDDFAALRREMDPAGKLGNTFVDRVLG